MSVRLIEEIVPVPDVIKRRAWECVQDIIRVTPMPGLVCLARQQPDSAYFDWGMSRYLFRLHRLIFGTRV